MFTNIDLSNCYTKTEVDDIDNELSTLILNTYTKAEVDTQLTDYMTTLSITATLMNNYASLTLIGNNFYGKLYLDNQFSLKADASNTATTNYLTTNYTNTVDLTSVDYNKTETGNMLLSYSTGSYVDYNFYTKTETDTLLADKLTNIGNIELPGWLDIGTPGYTNSHIRCNADVNGYTGYAELRAASSYDMLLNLNTTYPNGGWVYSKINNDDYMQLSGSDNKVNIYKDTTISVTLNAQRLSITNTTSRPIEINNTMHNGSYLVVISQNYSNNGLLFALRC